MKNAPAKNAAAWTSSDLLQALRVLAMREAVRQSHLSAITRLRGVA